MKSFAPGVTLGIAKASGYLAEGKSILGNQASAIGCSRKPSFRREVFSKTEASD